MFTFQDFFSKPVIPFLELSNAVKHVQYEKETVSYIYNSYGYRTCNFEDLPREYVLISGCSLTEGIGLHLPQTWGYKIQEHTKINVCNIAKGGVSSEFVKQNIINWINGYSIQPKAIVVQWPNPFRQLHWYNSRALFVLSQSADELFKLKLKHGVEYFFLSWVNSIIELNKECANKKIPILNLCFEGEEMVAPAMNILTQHSIDLHLDLKQPGSTWHFDNSAADQLHHSDWCTAQWAKRILTLLQPML